MPAHKSKTIMPKRKSKPGMPKHTSQSQLYPSISQSQLPRAKFRSKARFRTLCWARGTSKGRIRINIKINSRTWTEFKRQSKDRAQARTWNVIWSCTIYRFWARTWNIVRPSTNVWVWAQTWRFNLVPLTKSEYKPNAALDPMPLLELVTLSSNKSINSVFHVYNASEYGPLQDLLTKMSIYEMGIWCHL